MSTIACWCCRALFGDRSNTLAFILNTMGSLGTKLSLDKGSRASRATWLGVSLHLIDKDTLVVGLREKAIDDIDELQGILGKMGECGLCTGQGAAGRQCGVYCLEPGGPPASLQCPPGPSKRTRVQAPGTRNRRVSSR